MYMYIERERESAEGRGRGRERGRSMVFVEGSTFMLQDTHVHTCIEVDVIFFLSLSFPSPSF